MKVCERYATNRRGRLCGLSRKVPGVFAFVGSDGEPDAPDWHHDDFIVKDEALSVAVHYYVENALLLLDYYKEKNQ